MKHLLLRSRVVLAIVVLLAILASPYHTEARDCSIVLHGNVNQDGAITSADLIATVNLAFKCDFNCPPCDFVRADVNCSGNLTSTDVILMVNFIFKGGTPYCDICPLLEDGTYPPGTCP
jgi:hypothetical protein